MPHDDPSSDSHNPYVSPLTSSTVAGTSIEGEVAEDEKLKPFKTIWLHPRVTVRRIVAHNPNLHVVLLVCLAGIAKTLDRASMKSVGDQVSTLAVFGIACVFGPLGGLLGLWIGSHLIRLTGKLLGGAGVRVHIRTAIGWSSVPAVFALPLWIPLMILFGSEMFTEQTPRLDSQPMLWIPLVAIAVAQLVLGIWSIVLLCHTVAGVQGFRSAWRGRGNLILAFLLFLVPWIAFIMMLVLLMLPRF